METFFDCFWRKEMNEHQKKVLELLMQLQDKIAPETQFTTLAWFIMFGRIPYLEQNE